MIQPPHQPSDDPTADEARVRQLLASLADPGPMPDDLVERITARLEAERRDRFDEGATVVPFPEGGRRAPSRRFVMAMGGAAAAAAVVGVLGVQAIQSPTGTSVLAALSRKSGSDTTVHTNVSATKYTTANLGAQAAALVTASATQPPLGRMAAESPMTGPLGTTSGVHACLGSLGLSGPAVVDMAFFDGKPAAVLVTGDATHREVRVVPRTCGNGESTVVYGPVPVS